jgi:hypothetical protein
MPHEPILQKSAVEIKRAENGGVERPDAFEVVHG